MAIWELSLSGQPEKFGVTFNGTQYLMRFTYADTAEGAWILDIGAADGTPLLCGVPLLPDQNLLEQHAHLDIGGQGSGLYLRTRDYKPPVFDNPGESTLVFADGE